MTNANNNSKQDDGYLDFDLLAEMLGSKEEEKEKDKETKED